jgi:hypothetical protein
VPGSKDTSKVFCGKTEKRYCLPQRLEIIKFMNCSLGTSGTSNHPRLGKLQKDPRLSARCLLKL